jgi:hypothetical protein
MQRRGNIFRGVERPRTVRCAGIILPVRSLTRATFPETFLHISLSPQPPVLTVLFSHWDGGDHTQFPAEAAIHSRVGFLG